MIESNDQNDGNNSSEDIIEAFLQIKELFRQKVTENEKLRQNLDFIENNKEFGQRYTDHLKDQIKDLKDTIDSQQKTINQLKRFEEANNELNEKISSLKTTLKINEESNQQIVDKIRSQMDFEIKELQNCLEIKDKEIQDLKLTINSKDILLNQSKRELSDNWTKSEENKNEIKEFYEKRIKTLYKEFDEKYQKMVKQNDEKIIEIRANCMRSVDKTKEEFETKLTKTEIENKELKEKYSHLRLELEALKMSPQFENSKNISKYKNISKTKTNTGSQNKSKPSIRILDFEDDSEEPKESNTAQKRKKLIPNNDSYLDFVRDH